MNNMLHLLREHLNIPIEEVGDATGLSFEELGVVPRR